MARSELGVWLVLCLAIALGLCSTASAHPAATSVIIVEQGARATQLELQLPVDQLATALQTTIEAPDRWLDDNRARMQAYLAEHLALRSEDGVAWTLEPAALTTESIDDAPHIVAHVTATPPDGADSRAAVLHCDAIVHRVVSHRLQVLRGRNFEHARFDGEPEPLGLLHYQRKEIGLADEGGSWWRGFMAMVGLGADHIAHGSDHLLFILALLLAAVVRPEAGRWQSGRSISDGARTIAWVVTAFTLGHSLTLVLGVTGVVLVPSQPVEIAVALTLVISAVHALRPIFPWHEAWVAGVFGLVHGLAFASELAGFAPDTAALALGLAGFNLGIELVQLVIVAALAPSLLLLARTSAYRTIRIAGGAVIGVAALIWLLARVGVGDQPDVWFNVVDRLAPWVIAALAIGLATLSAGRSKVGFAKAS